MTITQLLKRECPRGQVYSELGSQFISVIDKIEDGEIYTKCPFAEAHPELKEHEIIKESINLWDKCIGCPYISGKWVAENKRIFQLPIGLSSLSN